MAFSRSSLLCVFLVAFLLFQTSCTGEKEQPTGVIKPQGWAEQASTCNPPMSGQGSCNQNNSCTAAGNCSVSVAINGNSVNVTLNGAQPVDPICVPQGKQIQWSTTTANSNFIIDFGNAPPFANNNVTTFSGDNYTNGQNNPVTQTIVSVNQCYKYNIKVCPNTPAAANGTIACAESDPKVIVGSGNQMPRDK